MEVSSPTPSESMLASSRDGVHVDIEAKPILEPRADIGDLDVIRLPSTNNRKKRRREDKVAKERNESASSLANKDSVAPVAGILSHNGGNTTDAIHRSEPEVTKTPCLLKLPFELLSEILIRTGSPQHILAVARTCKSLCHTLLRRDVQFIWREARKGPGCVFETPLEYPGDTNQLFQLPDPPAEFFGEAAYAAFIFDSGKCDSCWRETSDMYSSFAIRARLCKHEKCYRPLNITTLVRSARDPTYDVSWKLREILPVNEVQDFKVTNVLCHAIHWPNGGMTYCNTEAHNAAKTEYILNHNDPGYQEKFEKLKLRKKRWMELCVELAKWKRVRQYHYCKNKKNNEIFGKQIASKYGWEYNDAFCATSYGVYQIRKNKLIESVDEIDVRIMKEKIEAELLAHGERRERRTAEMTLMSNRKDVEALYLRLRSKGGHPYLPSISTFRQLPAVAMLQSAEPGTSFSSAAGTLRSNAMTKNLLSSQLKKWTEKAMQDLAVKLGFSKNWKSASKNILHPVERVTARFLCTKCQRVGAKYGDDESLNFAGVCTHECGVWNAKKGRASKGKEDVWESANFVKDEKAINALRKCLRGLGYAEDGDGGNYMLKTGIAAVCTSCDPPMVVDTRNVIGHSHRHENMEVTFESLGKIKSYLGTYPYEYGVCQKLLDPSGASQAAKLEIEKRNFGCRHCLRAQQVKKAGFAAAARGDSIPLGGSATEGAAANNNAQDIAMVVDDPDAKAQIELATVVSRMHDSGIEGPLEKPQALFTFHGLRSHLKSKHGVENVGDEDIFCYREVLP